MIDHTKLLSKLQAHGIDPSWFSAYLKDHTQSASVTDNLGDVKKSHPLPNNIGIFQGSSLGPLLYSIFANDIGQFVEDAVIVQYADDTQILISGKKSEISTVVSRMQNVLASLDIWFRANGLKVNASKTQLMLLGSPQNLRTLPDIRVTFRDHDLLPISEAKHLGLIFDLHLPISVILSLVDALIISWIRYCISVYGFGGKQNLSRAQKSFKLFSKGSVSQQEI